MPTVATSSGKGDNVRTTHALLNTVFYFSFTRDVIYTVTGKTTFLRPMLKGKKRTIWLSERPGYQP